MRFEIPSDLPKLGERPYIQGGTIFNGIIDAFDCFLGPAWLDGASISSFKLEREAVANGRIVVSDTAGERAANAVLVVRQPAGPLHGYFIDAGIEARRIPYDEASYYRVVDVGSDLAGNFRFPGGRPRGDFMRAVVGANKLLHQKTDRFGGELQHIQFLYLKDLDAVCLQRVAEDYEVSITNASVQDRGHEVWTINRVSVRGATFVSEFRICYRAQKARAVP